MTGRLVRLSVFALALVTAIVSLSTGNIADQFMQVRDFRLAYLCQSLSVASALAAFAFLGLAAWIRSRHE